MKSKGLFMVLLSLLLGFGAAWMAKNWLEQRTLAAEARNAGMTVAVAAMEIPYGTTIEARHVKLISVPTGTPLGNYFSNVEDIMGKVATQKQLTDEVLLKERFTAAGAGSTLAALIRPDMRAVTVRVDDVVGVAGFLLPGNHVDVIAARKVEERATTHTILSDLNVLAVDQSSSADKNEPVVVRAVTLEMSPQQAEVLMRAREEGRIQLTLRNPNDKSVVSSEPEQKVAAAPAPVRKASRPAAPAAPVAPVRMEPMVTIIRGTNVNNTNVNSTISNTLAR